MFINNVSQRFNCLLSDGERDLNKNNEQEDAVEGLLTSPSTSSSGCLLDYTLQLNREGEESG